MTQCIQEQIGVFPAVETKLHLLQVSRKMFRADSVPCSDNPAFQQRECGLDSVRMNISANINLIFVANGFVLVGFTSHCEWVCWMFIGHDYVNIFADVLRDDLVN